MQLPGPTCHQGSETKKILYSEKLIKPRCKEFRNFFRVTHDYS